MIWMWDEEGEFKGQTVMLWRAYAGVLAEAIEGWLLMAPSTKGEPMKESLDWTAEEVESHERWRKSWRGRLFFLRFDFINFMRSHIPQHIIPK